MSCNNNNKNKILLEKTHNTLEEVDTKWLEMQMQIQIQIPTSTPISISTSTTPISMEKKK